MFNIKYRIPDGDREGLLFRQLRLSYCGHELDEFPKLWNSSSKCTDDHFPASNEHLRHCPNGFTLSDHGIKSHAVLHLVSTIGRNMTINLDRPNGARLHFVSNMTINVECPTGALLTFLVSECTRIVDLQMRLHLETGIALRSQRLIFNGVQLCGGSCSDHNFTDGCTIDFLMGIRTWIS
jgi:hypothetical protein